MTETSSENSLPEDSLIVAVTSEPGQALAEEPAENPALKPVVRAIQRLEDVIDTETRLLLEGGNPDLAEINARKSRGLYDFNKAIKKAAGAAEPATMKPLQPLLDSLKHKLEKNCEALQTASAGCRRTGRPHSRCAGNAGSRRHLFHAEREARSRTMIRIIAIGLWICAVAFGSLFFAVRQNASSPDGAQAAVGGFGGVDYVKTDVMSVPILSNGGVAGYVVTQLVYTIDLERSQEAQRAARILHQR